MFMDILETISTGSCSLCHKQSRIAVINKGICMADHDDLAEDFDDSGVDELKVVEKDGVLYLVDMNDFPEQEEHEASEEVDNEENS